MLIELTPTAWAAALRLEVGLPVGILNIKTNDFLFDPDDNTIGPGRASRAHLGGARITLK